MTENHGLDIEEPKNSAWLQFDFFWPGIKVKTRMPKWNREGEGSKWKKRENENPIFFVVTNFWAWFRLFDYWHRDCLSVVRPLVICRMPLPFPELSIIGLWWLFLRHHHDLSFSPRNSSCSDTSSPSLLLFTHKVWSIKIMLFDIICAAAAAPEWGGVVLEEELRQQLTSPRALSISP